MAAAPRVSNDDVITDVTSTFLIGLDDEDCPDVSAHVASYVGNVDRLRSILARVRTEMMRQPRIFLAFFCLSQMVGKSLSETRIR
jgi:hypothetical protein